MLASRSAIDTTDASLKQPTEKAAPIPPEASGLFSVRRRLDRPVRGGSLPARGPARAQAPAAGYFSRTGPGAGVPLKMAEKFCGVSCGRKNKHIRKMLKIRRLGPT